MSNNLETYDVVTLLVAEYFGITPSQVTPEMRTGGKRLFYGKLYSADFDFAAEMERLRGIFQQRLR